MNVQELKKSLDELSLKFTGPTQSQLVNELNHLVVAGGKKFRPGLLFVMGDLFGFTPKELTAFARAVELTHLASLIHDDVIDESNARRNHPTLNSLRNNTTAILAGDYVLATIMRELAGQNNNEILIDLTESIQDLADGEWLQFDLKKKQHVLHEDLNLIAVKKTGSLIRWCCTTPAKLGGYPDIASMKQLGERIGLIFQMADDIVDGLPLSGRPPFQDLINGQLNFVTLKLIELYPELYNSVYEFKKNPMIGAPWTKQQYSSAIQGVDQDIKDEMSKIFSVFSSLCHEKKKTDLIPVFEAMINKIQSNYSTFFENLASYG